MISKTDEWDLDWLLFKSCSWPPTKHDWNCIKAVLLSYVANPAKSKIFRSQNVEIMYKASAYITESLVYFSYCIYFCENIITNMPNSRILHTSGFRNDWNALKIMNDWLYSKCGMRNPAVPCIYDMIPHNTHTMKHRTTLGKFQPWSHFHKKILSLF